MFTISTRPQKLAVGCGIYFSLFLLSLCHPIFALGAAPLGLLSCPQGLGSQDHWKTEIADFLGVEAIPKIQNALEALKKGLEAQIFPIDGLLVTPILAGHNGMTMDMEELRREDSYFKMGPIDESEISSALRLTYVVKNWDGAESALKSSPRIREVAEFVNALFQNPTEIFNFAKEVHLQSLQFAKSVNKERTLRFLKDKVTFEDCPWGMCAHYVSGSSGFGRNYVIPTLLKMGQAVGWIDTIEQDELNIDYFQESIGKKRIPLDVEYHEKLHSMSAHFFQIVLASLAIEKKFGNARVWEFFEFLATPAGQRLWVVLFDRGPSHTRDFRGPAFQLESGLSQFMDLW